MYIKIAAVAACIGFLCVEINPLMSAPFALVAIWSLVRYERSK